MMMILFGNSGDWQGWQMASDRETVLGKCFGAGNIGFLVQMFPSQSGYFWPKKKGAQILGRTNLLGCLAARNEHYCCYFPWPPNIVFCSISYAIEEMTFPLLLYSKKECGLFLVWPYLIIMSCGAGLLSFVSCRMLVCLLWFCLPCQYHIFIFHFPLHCCPFPSVTKAHLW